MNKLWDKGFEVDEMIAAFTVGRDRELDVSLAPYDILGTIAHVTMLESRGLLTREDLEKLLPELRKMYQKAAAGEFAIDPDVEDVHSQVEMDLTRKLGDLGKKIHTGRSRNDQVAVDLRLFARARMEKTVGKVKVLFDILQERSEECKDILMPGYTHLQVAMPSSFGLWFGAYAESLADDLAVMKGAWEVNDRNPLGSAAGYGSSAPLDRGLTTRLLGFGDLDFNSVYAQMGRGKVEKTIAFAYAGIAGTVGKLAMDCCLFNSQNFGFIRLPDSLTTGSSIMPHKKNPDVFELIRSHCNRIQGIPNDIGLITGNLPSGYFRDLQLIKEVFIPMFSELDDVLDIAAYAMKNVQVAGNLMDNPVYNAAFSVEEANRLVEEGVPFRDAYRRVADEIMDGSFRFKGSINHTHEGSVGNLCNDRIAARMEGILSSFPFGRVSAALTSLVKD